MHRAIHAANLPAPVGPYSPGMGFERLVFVSGQGATDPTTGKLAGPDVATQTEQCLKNDSWALLTIPFGIGVNEILAVLWVRTSRLKHDRNHSLDDLAGRLRVIR